MISPFSVLLILAGFLSTSYGLNLNFSNKDLLIEQKSIPDTTVNSIHYTSTKFLEVLFKTKGKFNPAKLTYSLYDSHGKKWLMVPDGTFLLIENETYHFPYPVIRSASDIFLPTQELLNLVTARFYFEIHFDKAQNTLHYDIGAGNILKIFHRTKENGSLVEIQTSKKLSFETLWVYPHFIINIQKGRLNSELLPPVEIQDGLVKKISTIQDTSVAQITLYIPHEIDTVTASLNDSGKTLSVLIRKPSDSKLAAQKQKITPKKPKSQKIIIIDPGHGGKDPGANFKNISEKAITLYVAKQLEEELKKRDYKVLLSRKSDKYIPLKDRPAFAAKNGGDLFISLHCNAIGGTPKKQKSVNGFVAYILRAGKSKEDKALAKRENQAIRETTQRKNKDQISPVEWILLEHELNLYSHQSEKFAEKIVRHFSGGRIKKHRTGAHQAGFFVLVGAFMPAVLFEMGFITNEKDRRYMSSKKGQKDIAHRLANAVDDYFAEAQ